MYEKQQDNIGEYSETLQLRRNNLRTRFCSGTRADDEPENTSIAIKLLHPLGASPNIIQVDCYNGLITRKNNLGHGAIRIAN